MTETVQDRRNTMQICASVTNLYWQAYQMMLQKKISTKTMIVINSWVDNCTVKCRDILMEGIKIDPKI